MPERFTIKSEDGKSVGYTLFDPIHALETYKRGIIRVERERDAAIERCKALQRENQALKAQKFDLVSALESKHLVIANPQMPYYGAIQRIKSYFKVRRILKGKSNF